MVEIGECPQKSREWRKTPLAIAGRTARRLAAISIGFGGPTLGTYFGIRFAEYLSQLTMLGQNVSKLAQATHGAEQILVIGIPFAIGVMGAVLLWPENPSKSGPTISKLDTYTLK
ncbi:MAG TPA: hypothetical protein VN711_02625 [Candidatus Saccharimonadales bacterium]|nr:hypothetical protein [Candidatus Saccharimonadales bacterium]